MFQFHSHSALATAAWWVLLPGGVTLSLLALLVWLGKIPLGYNLRNLLVRWKTTVMTALAFTLVISLLTVMLAFVNGMAKLTENSGQPGNVLILSAGMTDEAFSNLNFSDAGDIANQPGVIRENGRRLCSPETFVVVNQPILNPAPGHPKRRFLQLRGVDDAALAAEVHGLGLVTGGRWISDAGVERIPAVAGDHGPAATANEAVLGEGIARELGRDRSPAARRAARNPDRLAPGDLFTLRDRPWIVVGVMRSSGSTFDSEIWAKGSTIRQLFGKENSYSSLVLRTRDAAAAQQVKEYFNKDYQKAPLQALVETEYFASLSDTNRQFLYGTLIVAVFVSVGGIFGVMNTMFAAISQRTKDIGVLRILGFARWQILVSFLLESLAIAICGGLLGLGLGMLCHGWTATSIIGNSQGGGKFVVLRLAVDSRIVGVDLLLTLLMGLLGGLLPALTAVRMRPLEALR